MNPTAQGLAPVPPGAAHPASQTPRPAGAGNPPLSPKPASSSAPKPVSPGEKASAQSKATLDAQQAAGAQTAAGKTAAGAQTTTTPQAGMSWRQKRAADREARKLARLQAGGATTATATATAKGGAKSSSKTHANAEVTRANEMGIEHARKRHFDEAIASFKQAIDGDPKQPLYWNNLGSVYLSIDKPMPAKHAFSKAISLDHNNALAHYNLGAAKDAILDYDGAIESYARALELDPTLGDAAKHPPIVNNTHLAAIHTLLYKKQAGALGAPLESAVPKKEPAAK